MLINLEEQRYRKVLPLEMRESFISLIESNPVFPFGRATNSNSDDDDNNRKDSLYCDAKFKLVPVSPGPFRSQLARQRREVAATIKIN